MADVPDLAKTAAAIIEQTNVFRGSHDKQPLQRNLALDHAAKEFAQFLAKSSKFAHEADGRMPADRAKAAGYQYCSVAENLALNADSRGFTVEQLAKQAVEGWKESAGHRKNMLLPGVTEIGVGVAQAPGPELKFLSVQLLGRPLSLAVKFKVSNKSHDSITYSYGGETHTIEPLVTATHTGCDPGDVVFDRSGNWLTGVKINARYAARDGAHYILKPGADGRVRVHLQH